MSNKRTAGLVMFMPIGEIIILTRMRIRDSWAHSTRRLVGMSLFVGVITQLVVPSYGQPTDPAILEQSIRQFADPDWRTRSQAFYTLWQTGKPGLANLLRRWPERADALKLALIGLLEREIAFSREYESVYKKTGVPLGEAHGEYYGDVVDAVTSLKDIRSLNALIGVIQTGRMAESALAEFGSAALDRVVAVMDSGNIPERQGASYVLAQMLDPKNASKVSDPASRRKIRDALTRAARDESRWVRLGGIEGLRKLDEPEIIRFLQDLATGDPDEIVRNAAKEALKKPG